MYLTLSLYCHLILFQSSQYNNKLNKLPLEISHLTQLTEINLENNQLGEIPSEIGRLIRLTSLTLRNNQLSKLPLEIAHLTRLTTLNLIGNQLTELPSWIGDLTQLTHFYLSENPISTIPSEIGNLSNLVSLVLWNNQLSSLPPSIFHLSGLRGLGLAGNKLTTLSSDICQLTSLENLYLFNNEIDSLPCELGELTKLVILDVDNEKMRFPPTDVVKIGVDAIRNYLNAEDHHAVWESKCVVVGEGGVGKTWLIDALRGNQPDETIVGTVGIDIQPLTLPHPTETDVEMQLNCWDFAGQDFNHAMHQFFFSDRALIMLVWNARHGWEQGKLTRWLENIKVRAPHAAVLLVATHIEQPHSDYPKEQLKQDYPQIVETIEVDSKTGKDIPKLRELIREHAAQLPLMGVKWPSTWLSAANAVRDLCDTRPPLIPPEGEEIPTLIPLPSGEARGGREREQQMTHTTRSHIHTIMAREPHNLDTAQADILLRWMHELGDILNFPDETAIADYVLLNPEWLTKHLGIVLRSDEVLRRHGILSQAHLRDLWTKLDEQIRTLFLHIMDKFDLAYLIPNDPEDRSLIVERLPLDPPDYDTPWNQFDPSTNSGTEITLRFKLDSMQPGIPTWFIARCHRFTMGRDGNAGIHWHNGVLFQDEDARHRALVIANDHTRQVEMRVRGAFPQRFMSLLRDGLNDTIKTRYKGLKIEPFVPCPGYDQFAERDCINEFRLDALERRLIQQPNRDMFDCPECGTELSRLKLVEGLGQIHVTQALTEQRVQQLLEAQTKKITTRMDQSAIDVARYVERGFLRDFLLEQQRELITCPNLFTIYPIAQSGGITRRQEWHIQLYSQQPGDWRKAGEPYTIDELHDWFKKAAPYLRGLHKVLRFIIPVAGAALDVAGDASGWAKDQHDIFDNEIALMGKALSIDLLPSGDDDGIPRFEQVDDAGKPHKFDGADLVVIRELMDRLAEIDKKRGTPKWGGLTRRQTPEGDILWLDQEHLQAYLSKRPVPELPSINNQ